MVVLHVFRSALFATHSLVHSGKHFLQYKMISPAGLCARIWRKETKFRASEASFDSWQHLPRRCQLPASLLVQPGLLEFEPNAPVEKGIRVANGCLYIDCELVVSVSNHGSHMLRHLQVHSGREPRVHLVICLGPACQAVAVTVPAISCSHVIKL